MLTPEEDRQDELDNERDSVEVRFGTRADLLAGEMTDEDWINLGKFVAEVAADARRYPERV